MLHLILAAALMADAPSAAAAPAAPASPPDLRIGIADLSSCTALVNTLAANSPAGSEQKPTLEALGLNWSLVFDAAQSQSQQSLRPAYDKALTDYQTQIANASGDETLGSVILDRLNEGLARCETIRGRNREFFAFVLGDYIEEARARQAAAPAPVPAQP